MLFITKTVLSFFALLFSIKLYQAFLGPLSRYPGPLIAKFTNLWRLVDVWEGQHHETLRKLHKQHGSVVRIGPNLLSLSDPRWIKTVYSIKGDFQKSKFYIVNDVKLADGTIVPTTFSVLDNKTHAEMMKPIQNLYNLNNVLSYEAQIDEVLDLLTKTLDTFTDGRVVDIGKQLLYAAYDVIGNITLGAPDGYLEKQCDFEGTLEISDRIWDYFAPVTQMPWLDRWLAKSRWTWISDVFPSFGQNMHRRCAELIAARISESKEQKHADFLEDFIEIGGGRKEPNVPLLIAWLSSNVVAGSDTIAIQLRSTVYYVLKHPEVYKKLQIELDAANLTLPISYRKATDNLPYLEAVIGESLRLHPGGAGLPMERVVPDGGVKLPDGPFLRGTTQVGMSAWIVHLDELFGPNPESFSPERWLPQDNESAETHKARIRRMHDADLTFGAGRRICSGRFVAQIEVYKVLATLFSLYDLRLVDPGKEWRVKNSWFVRQEGIEVFVERRR